MAKTMDIVNSARKVDPTVWTLGIAGAVALGISVLVNWGPGVRKAGQVVEANPPILTTGTVTPASSTGTAVAQAPTPSAPTAPAMTGPKPAWAASATGRIEPKDGELRIPALLQGRIAEVAVKANDKVAKGDLLVRIDDEDTLLKVAAAMSEADVRKRERDEEEAKGLSLDRRRAEDAVYDAEQALFKARMAFDAAGTALRAGRGSADDVKAAKDKIAPAEERVTQQRAELTKLLAKNGLPLPTRLESSVAVARSDVAAAELAVEKMHVRAPYDGTVLSLPAKEGEVAAPSPEAPLSCSVDLSGLKVQAPRSRSATPPRSTSVSASLSAVTPIPTRL